MAKKKGSKNANLKKDSTRAPSAQQGGRENLTITRTAADMANDMEPNIAPKAGWSYTPEREGVADMPQSLRRARQAAANPPQDSKLKPAREFDENEMITVANDFQTKADEEFEDVLLTEMEKDRPRFYFTEEVIGEEKGNGGQNYQVKLLEALIEQLREVWVPRWHAVCERGNIEPDAKLQAEFDEQWKAFNMKGFRDEAKQDALKRKLAKEQVKGLLQRIFEEVARLEGEEQKKQYESALEAAKTEILNKKLSSVDISEPGYDDDEAEDMIDF